MTEKLANLKFDFNAAKATLLERVEANSVFTYNGGLFKANSELMAVVTSLVHRHNSIQTDINHVNVNMVLLDEYKNPIKIGSAIEFQRQLNEAHQFALNTYLVDYENMRKIRNGNQV